MSFDTSQDPLQTRASTTGRGGQVNPSGAAPTHMPYPAHAADRLLQAALALAGQGWHVFPCHPGTKRPAIRDWERRATIDPGRIIRCWEHGHCNIGIACGPSALVVLDLDTPGHTRRAAAPGPPDAAEDGAQILTRLCRHLAQPYPAATFTVRTPSGGQHLYFTSGTMTLRNTAGRLGPLIDTRARGGYVLAPGSVISGRTYTVTNPAAPLPLPPWLAGLLTDHGQHARGPGPSARLMPAHAPRYALAALRAETRRVATATTGTRNDTLNRAAFALGQLAATRLLPAPLVRHALTDAALHAGLPAREARATIASGMSAGARKPRHAAV